MSGTLTEAALPGDLEAPSTEVAPEVVPGAVADGSAPGDSVPKARFDGLMGRLQKEINETSSIEVERDRLAAEVESLRSTTSRENEDLSEIAELKEQVAVLANLLTTREAKSARDTVLAEFPELAPIADLLVGDDPDELREVANRLKPLIATQAPVEETEPVDAEGNPVTPAVPAEPVVPATPAVPVTGGGVAFEGASAIEDRVSDAVKKKDFAGFLKAARERATQGLVLEEG